MLAGTGPSGTKSGAPVTNSGKTGPPVRGVGTSGDMVASRVGQRMLESGTLRGASCGEKKTASKMQAMVALALCRNFIDGQHWLTEVNGAANACNCKTRLKHGSDTMLSIRVTTTSSYGLWRLEERTQGCRESLERETTMLERDDSTVQ